ncbi:MAG TPA: proton-conducting transporter membrane subunit [Acetobacteraceae bacterium]|nr:proton-conducting transporter membrane subunit [Acetobacteraceae bacterium]
MTGFALPALASLSAVLLLLGLAPDRRAGLIATGGLCGAAGLLTLAYLLAGAPAATLPLPVGLPGSGMTFGIDGLSAWFLLLVFWLGAAASVAALDQDSGKTAPAFPLFIAGMALTLLAADGFALVFGFELMSVASFVLVLTQAEDAAARAAALLYLGMAVLGAACLVPAFALLGGGSFAAMRAHPPDGWRAAAVLALVLIGAGSKAGFAPLHVWLPPAHATAPSHVSALMSGAMTKVGLYVVIRFLLDLCGPAQPLWWAIPLLAVGAGGAVLGALRANMEVDLKLVLACSTVENLGLMAIGLGVALAARATDLTALAALGLTGTLLHAMAHGTFKGLLFLGAGAVQHHAGTRSLARLGGLIHRMPVTTAAMLAGAAGLAALPPTGGFAGEWTLFQAIIAAPHVGGLGFQLVTCVVAALMALAAALAAAAAIRLIGIGFLGRPRSPRAAAATEPGAPMRSALIGLAGVTGIIGLFPGTVLALADPALRALLPGRGIAARSLLLLAPQPDAPGYVAVGIAALLGLAAGAIILAMRGRVMAGHATSPAWDCGFGAPPPWLPFGDPATQYGAASFAQPLRRTLAGALLAARQTLDMPPPGDTRPALYSETDADPADAGLFQPGARMREAASGFVDRMQFLTIRRTLVVMFSVLVLFLAAVAVLQQT